MVHVFILFARVGARGLPLALPGIFKDRKETVSFLDLGGGSA